MSRSSLKGTYVAHITNAFILLTTYPIFSSGSSPVSCRRLSDVLKRKKPPKRGAGRKGSRSDDPTAELLAAKGAIGGGGRATPTTRGKALAGICKL